MTRPSPTWLLPVLRLGVFALAAVLIAIGVWNSRPPHVLTIETGPVGGSYYDTALRYREVLAARGIDLRIITKDNTLEIVKDVANPDVPIDFGFVAEDVSAVRDSNVSIISLIQLQPLFVFANAELGRRSVVDDLRGRKIVTLPLNSATASAALQVFELFDINQENTSFTFLPLADAVRELRAGKFDAGVFMLAAENKLIRDMAEDSGLHLMPFSELHAITTKLTFLRPVVLSRGLYNIADAIPGMDTGMLAAAVGVVAHKGLHPWLIYSLLDAIAKTHRGASLVSDAGDFPTIVGSQLEVEPIAAAWYKVGVPWVWREFPPLWASFVDHYEPAILAAVVIGALVVTGTFIAEILYQLIRTLLWFGRRGGRS